MCGIAGFMVSPADRGLLNTQRMTTSLAWDMMARGKDATGIATVDFKGRWKVRKKNVAADVFLAGRDGIGYNAQSVLIHTRAATQGRPENMANNHPIIHGGIVGVHNGIVYNDDDLFKHYDWKRNAQVDSEAIFAAINYLDLDEAMTNIDASWAVAWLDTDDDARKVWLARGYQSPLCYAMTVNGSIVFASTEKAVEEAFEWGGVNGKPFVIKAEEGFLAHTRPDEGGIEILPKFDGSGKDAIGARKWKGNTYSHGGWTSGYEDWESASAGFTRSTTPASTTPPVTLTRINGRTPTAYERIWISGDPKNVKVGDRRKYYTPSGAMHTEVCITTSGVPGNPGIWSCLLQGSDRTVSGMQVEEKPEIVHTPVRTPLPELVDPFDEGEDERETLAEVIAGFSPDLDEDARYGFGQPGDLIAIEKETFLGGDGVLVGKVLSIDPDSGEMHVEFRDARINYDADYEVIGRFSTTS